MRMTRSVWLSVLLVPLVFGYGRTVTTGASPPVNPPTRTHQEPSSPVPGRASAQREFVDANCVACHNEQLLTAGLTLEGIDVEHVDANLEVWEKVLHKLGTGQMPPTGMPRPDASESRSILSWLETELDRVAAANPEPGTIGVHRLNQTEYANAVRDLLALEVDGKLATASRRGRGRLRQHCLESAALAGAPGTLHVGGSKGQPARRG